MGFRVMAAFHDASAQQRNAAIWYAKDGFDPQSMGINGRRVAGQSFLKGFLRHAVVDEFVFFCKAQADLDPVRKTLADLRPEIPMRSVGMVRPDAISPLACMFYPSPNFAAECWRRGPYGQSSWSICGITHTTSTTAVMQGMFDLRMAPIAAWDAVICTSQAVRASVLHQMELIDDHIRAHFRAEPPARPMFPVIPLGVDCNSFSRDPKAGSSLRERLGATSADVVFTTIARLTPHEKFDPLPIYLAMQAVQSRLQGQKLHVVFCGQFKDDHSRAVFTEGARHLMPDVGFMVMDGADACERKAALSGADVFLFLIDNIQETFGLAPIEAMAAGLPLLVSDWDGMKDTVTEDVGFRVTTRSLPPRHLVPEALRYQGGVDNYVQYCASNSAMIEIDQDELRVRIGQLVADPALRRRMGEAGQRRARLLYDWSVIVPQMQDLWAEQAQQREAEDATAIKYAPAGLPIAPSPTGLFATYPTEQTRFLQDHLVPVEGAANLQDLLALRNYPALKRMFADPEQIALVLAAICSGQDHISTITSETKLPQITVERIAIWLLKYGLIRRHSLK